MNMTRQDASKQINGPVAYESRDSWSRDWIYSLDHLPLCAEKVFQKQTASPLISLVIHQTATGNIVPQKDWTRSRSVNSARQVRVSMPARSTFSQTCLVWVQLCKQQSTGSQGPEEKLAGSSRPSAGWTGAKVWINKCQCPKRSQIITHFESALNSWGPFSSRTCKKHPPARKQLADVSAVTGKA